MAAKWKGHGNSITCVDVSSLDERMVLTGSEDSSCRVWDSRSARSVRRLGGVFHGEPVNSACFCAAASTEQGSGSTEHLVLAASGSTVATFDLRQPAVVLNEARAICAHNEDEINQVVVATWAAEDRSSTHAHTQAFVSVDDSCGGVVVDCDSGEMLARLAGAHENLVMATAFLPRHAGSEDEPLVVTGACDASIAVWGVRTGQLRQQLHMTAADAEGPRVAPGGAGPTTGGEGGASATGAQLFNPPLVHGLSLSPRGAMLAAALGDSSVAIFDVRRSSASGAGGDNDAQYLTSRWRLPSAHAAAVASVHFARFRLAPPHSDTGVLGDATAGATLISAGNDGHIVLWHVPCTAEGNADDDVAADDTDAPPVVLDTISHGLKPNWVATSSKAGSRHLFVADTSNELSVYSL